MLDAFLRVRLDGKLDPGAFGDLHAYLAGLLEEHVFPVYRGCWIDVDAMSAETGIAPEVLLDVRPHLQPLCDAISGAATGPESRRKITAQKTPVVPEAPLKPRGRPRRPLELGSPQPLWTVWADPETFEAALRLHMARHGDSLRGLHAALAGTGSAPCLNTLALWHRGSAIPSEANPPTLAIIERRYALPVAYFDAKIGRRSRVNTARGGFVSIPYAERRRLAWHLPGDFDQRSAPEQEEILAGLREVVISGQGQDRWLRSDCRAGLKGGPHNPQWAGSVCAEARAASRLGERARSSGPS